MEQSLCHAPAQYPGGQSTFQYFFRYLESKHPGTWYTIQRNSRYLVAEVLFGQAYVELGPGKKYCRIGAKK